MPLDTITAAASLPGRDNWVTCPSYRRPPAHPAAHVLFFPLHRLFSLSIGQLILVSALASALWFALAPRYPRIQADVAEVGAQHSAPPSEPDHFRPMWTNRSLQLKLPSASGSLFTDGK